MSELRLISSCESIEKAPAVMMECVSEAERELKNFIKSMTKLIGPDASGALTELWLNELSGMERMPGTEDFNWRSVSMSASLKLASEILTSQDSCQWS